MGTLFQAGTLVAFLQGVCEGDYCFGDLAKKGNFGLGTLNGVNGEMVAVDGNFYCINAKGGAHLIAPSECTPFSVVSWFQPGQSLAIQDVPNLAALNQVLDGFITTTNIFYMIRIDGELDWIKLRSEKCQASPYKPLAESLPKLQTIFELTHTTGTLVVTRCPNYAAAVTIPGYHYHYIDEARTTGGHVFDLRLKSAQVTVNPIRQFEMALFNTPDFDMMNLDIDIFSALKKIE